MKLLVITFACLIAYVTANCDDTPDADVLAFNKCHHDLVFRGFPTSGSSSVYHDGPYEWFYRVDNFNVNEVYRGPNDIETTRIVFRKLNDDSSCSNYPFGGGEVVVFAKLNTTYNYYQVYPCGVNPSVDCISDMDAFEGVQCGNHDEDDVAA